MSELLNQFAEQFLVGPVWPATVLLALLLLYALAMILGFGFDFELDVDVDVDVPDLEVDVPDLEGIDTGSGADGGGPNGTFGGVGAMTIRWSNLGRVPVAIWGGVFTLVFWAVSYLIWHSFDSSRYAAALLPSTLLTIRNTVVAVVLTKLITQPLVGKFDSLPGYDTKRIVGSTAEISSIEATPSFGQAKFRTNAAPLLLNVRTDGPTIPRGTEVLIQDFDPQKRIYTVTNINSETQS